MALFFWLVYSHGMASGLTDKEWSKRAKWKLVKLFLWPSIRSHSSLCAKSLQLCPTLCDPMDCSLPGASVHGILQARILEWVAMPFSRESSWPGDQTCVSYISCIGRQVLYHWTTWKAPHHYFCYNDWPHGPSLTQCERKPPGVWLSGSKLLDLGPVAQCC